MKIISRFTLIISLLLCSLMSFAQDTSGHLVNLLQSFNSMTSNFTQTSSDQAGRVIKQSQGTMALQRPGKFRWQIQTPSKQLIVADGNTLWIYDSDLEQVTKQNLSQSKTTNPASLLSGDVQAIQQRFNIKEEGPQSFELTPKAKNDLFNSVKLTFKNNVLNQMRVVDNLGQITTFTFINPRINPNLSSSTFIFSPPKGVDIIKQ